MKDEEIDKMADDFVNAQEFTKVYGVARKAECGAFWKYGFLAGLTAGRPQWHDLRENPNDLPKEQKEYWCKVFLYESEETFNAFLWYDLKTKSFMFEENIEEGLADPFNVKEWCEIPTFDKE